jgi:ABC-2 type transport system permease protein
MTMFPMMYSFVIATITLAAGYALYGLQLHWSTVPLSIPVMVLTLLAFLPFGLLFAALTLVVKQGNVGTSWVIALLSIVGGLYFPVALLPHWVQVASTLQPFTAATDVLRHLLVGSSAGGAVGPALLKLVAFAIVLLPGSIMILSHAIRVGQRRGTIIEY